MTLKEILAIPAPKWMVTLVQTLTTTVFTGLVQYFLRRLGILFLMELVKYSPCLPEFSGFNPSRIDNKL